MLMVDNCEGVGFAASDIAVGSPHVAELLSRAEHYDIPSGDIVSAIATGLYGTALDYLRFVEPSVDAGKNLNQIVAGVSIRIPHLL